MDVSFVRLQLSDLVQEVLFSFYVQRRESAPWWVVPGEKGFSGSCGLTELQVYPLRIRLILTGNSKLRWRGRIELG